MSHTSLLHPFSFKMVSLMRRPDAEMAEGVGMWSTLMEAMGLLAILTNTAIICFTSGTLDSRCGPVLFHIP